MCCRYDLQLSATVAILTNTWLVRKLILRLCRLANTICQELLSVFVASLDCAVRELPFKLLAGADSHLLQTLG